MMGQQVSLTLKKEGTYKRGMTLTRIYVNHILQDLSKPETAAFVGLSSLKIPKCEALAHNFYHKHIFDIVYFCH